MGGRVQTGDIETRVMVMESRGDNLSWPLFNASYAEPILGKAKADQMMRSYLHDIGGGEPGIWQQSLQDMMAWVEKGVPPLPSTAYVIRNARSSRRTMRPRALAFSR